MTAVVESVRLRPGVSTVRTDDGACYLIAFPDTELLNGAEEAAVRALASTDGYEAPATDHGLDRLRGRGWLECVVGADDIAYYTLQPDRASAAGQPVTPPDSVHLSRFAVIRRRDNQTVVESPRAWARIVLHDPGLAAVVVEPAIASPDIPGDIVARIRLDLVWAGLAVSADDAHGADEDSGLAGLWSSEDLTFHRSSRGRDHRTPFGVTWRGKQLMPSSPAQPPRKGPTVPFPAASEERHHDDHHSFDAVLARRRSVRSFGERPVEFERLAEFLRRTCRSTDIGDHDGFEVMHRPYPSGGAIHELEVYPIVRDVEGLEPGIYHYDTHTHALEEVKRSKPAVEAATGEAAAAMGASSHPPVLFMITARFDRMFWKYEGLGYALILKNVGVLIQTMYLVGTDMGLGGCALGSVPQAWDAIWPADPLAEDAVGAFTFGVPTDQQNTSTASGGNQ